MSDDPNKPWRDPAEEPGVGFLSDGTLNVVSPEEHKKRAIERNAEEALENESSDPEDVDDISDLDE